MSKIKKGIKEIEKTDDGLSLYEELILAAIKTEPHRPRAIVRICKNKIDQNQVVQILNKLKEKGLVKTTSNKSWQAV
ncbi:MAG: MarR family transcriptional regulator [Candidatus Helarchaeota archaeon]